MPKSGKITSGQNRGQQTSLDPAEVVSNVRQLTWIPAERGLDDDHILAGVAGFVDQFEFWYIRVIREAVPNYRRLVIARINPFVRRVELDGLNAFEVATRLVDDYNRRNFVTAGGWAIEKMAVEASPLGQKSTAVGIYVERHDAKSGITYLYVMTSGLVTRNSDILSSLKRNARQAENRLLQGRAAVAVRANYAIAAGKTSSRFEDGIWRPASGEFWAEILGLTEEDAIETALAMAAEAGRLVRRDASCHISAMTALVAVYIGQIDEPDVMDWEFITRRNMRTVAIWRLEDQERHARALEALRSTGYEPGPEAERAPPTGPVGTEDLELVERSALQTDAGEVVDPESEHTR